MSEANDISLEIPARVMPLSGAAIKRYLPFVHKRTVGPFIFFDYFPPANFAAGKGLQVSPHPHIGLSTLSYLLEGAVLHHDSLGCKQVLRPGDVNWMTAGSGISHSERVPEEFKTKPHRLHLMQFWVALPTEFEDTAPSFHHHPQNTIPHFKVGSCHVVLVAGEAFNQKSPVEIFSPLFFMDVSIPQNSSFEFDPKEQELALLVINGEIVVNSKSYSNNEFLVFKPGSKLYVSATQESKIILLGGQPLPEERYVFWNFVSSSKEKIEAAKKSWSNGSFPQVPGESDNLSLPE